MIGANKQTRFNPSPAHLLVSEANETGEKALTGACPRRRFEPVPSLSPNPFKYGKSLALIIGG